MRLTTGLGVLIALLTGLVAMPVLAQIQPPTQPIPPPEYSIDERNVDLTSGSYLLSVQEVAIGQPGAGGLVYGRSFVGDGWRDNQSGTINFRNNTVMVSVGGFSDAFSGSATGPYTPVTETGASLTHSAGVYTYTTGTGVVATFGSVHSAVATGYSTPQWTLLAVAESITTPTGEITTFNYETAELCIDFPLCPGRQAALRLLDVSNNFGYALTYTYRSNSTDDPTHRPWFEVDTVAAINRAVDTGPWPSVHYPTPNLADRDSSVDELGRTTDYFYNSGRVTGIRLPGSAVNDVTISYVGTTDTVNSVTDASGAWTYAFSGSGSAVNVTVQGPSGENFEVASIGGRVQLMTDADNGETEYTWSNDGLLEAVEFPNDMRVDYEYDARGNVTAAIQTPAPGSGLSPIETRWTYPSTCVDIRNCNQPTSMTDPRGFVTDYAYDTVQGHGQLTAVTYPARYYGWDRPQTRITYAQRQARYPVDQWSPVGSGPPVWLPIETSGCAFSTTCDGAASELVSAVIYDSTTTGNNLLPITVTTGAGDNSLAVTTSTTWTSAGDPALIDGPLSGTADQTVYFYNAGRELLGSIGPDPDVTGPLAHRAMRILRNAQSGLVESVEQGTTPDYDSIGNPDFTMLQRITTSYTARRPVRQIFSDASTIFSITDQSYDASGRPDCAAMRMNPATYASPATAACTATTPGIYGPDRISRTTYDDFGRVASVISGYGSGDAVTQSLTYTVNGQVQTLLDGQNNLTTWEYDGFARAWRMYYPSASVPGTSSFTDYEAVTYNAASLPVSRQLRDGSVLVFAYDNLNALNFVDAPSGQQDVGQWFDNLGRMYTTISYGVDPQTLQFGNDILGRTVYEIGPLGTTSYLYNSASWLTRITWPDGYHADYDSYLDGSMASVRENGATSGVGVLASYLYDDLGRRIYVGRSNGAATGYIWDGGSRLTSLYQDLGGTAQDVGFTYTYNPAGQIVSRQTFNDLYAYTGQPSIADSYGINGLNQVTAINATGLSYDGRGNLTTVGSDSWAYDIYNRLTSANVSTTFGFDPASRLSRETSSGVTRQFLYTGAQAIGEYDGSGALVRRYVPGAGLDDYAAYTSGTGGGITRQWPITDQLGSVIGITDGSGVASQINAYDEYGAPQPGFAGPFGYAGSMTLVQANTAPWYMRNRQYHPGLGRFLQTDPIGMAGGLNLYAYVAGDPINSSDPYGLCDDYQEGMGCYWQPSGWAFCSVISGGGLPTEVAWETCRNEFEPRYYYVGGRGGSGGGSGGGGSAGQSGPPRFRESELNRCPTLRGASTEGAIPRAINEAYANVRYWDGEAGFWSFEDAQGQSHIRFTARDDWNGISIDAGRTRPGPEYRNAIFWHVHTWINGPSPSDTGQPYPVATILQNGYIIYSNCTRR